MGACLKVFCCRSEPERRIGGQAKPWLLPKRQVANQFGRARRLGETEVSVSECVDHVGRPF